jgi:hypothetical protein
MNDRASDELADLREEARYRREQLALYTARLYAGRVRGQGKLRELRRASEGAAARLRRAEARPSARLKFPDARELRPRRTN